MTTGSQQGITFVVADRDICMLPAFQQCMQFGNPDLYPNDTTCLFRVIPLRPR